MSSLRAYIDIVESYGETSAQSIDGGDMQHRASLEKWTRETLSHAGIKAHVSAGVVYVKDYQILHAAKKALQANTTLTVKLPVRIERRAANL